MLRELSKAPKYENKTKKAVESHSKLFTIS